MKCRTVAAVMAALLLASPGVGLAGKVKVWHHYNPGHYDKAQFKQAVVSNEGTLRLARRLEALPGLEAAHVWDVVEDRGGNLFVATGDEGKLFKVTPEGKVTVAYHSEDSEILCVALAPDGTVYAGTGPSGQVVHLDAHGQAKVIGEMADTYVWSLAIDATGQTIYAGTGPHGQVYRLTPEGKPSVFYTTRQEHIHCLALATDGSLYAGTDKAGLVYRIDSKGKGFVVFSAPQNEVRCLLATPEGVYAGTSTPTRKSPSGSGNTATSSGSPSGTSSGSQAVRLASFKGEGTPGSETTTSSSSSSESKESSKGSSAPSVPAPSSGENSLYRIAADGTVQEVFREKAMVLSLLRQSGHVFIGTGMEGQLFEVEEASHERSEIARLDHGQVLALHRRHDGSIVLGTGDPGKLYVLQDRYCAHGRIVSEVLDAKLVSKWGALSWKADTPTGTAVSVAVRSGNVAEPDDTWSDWSDEQTDAQHAIAHAPAARFLQYRVTLTTEDPTRSPAVHDVTLRYRTTNQAPEVSKVEVPDLDSGSVDNPKKLHFKWTATDANEDELTYTLWVRKQGWKEWVQLEEQLEKTEYEWDTTTAPSGVYELKVVASDRHDNSAEEALTAERISETFVVSHTPPEVTVKVVGHDGDQVLLEATAEDALARLTTASFAVNGKKWVNVFPTDGLFDGKSKTFRFRTESLKPGSHVLVLRVRDAAGNTGSGDVVFSVPAR